MSDDLSAALLDRIRGGDQEAAEELFHRYVVRLVQLARNNMSQKITRRVDPEDAVQSAYRSFFRRAREGAFELRQSGDLWKLLAAITINKVRRQARKQSAQKRRIETEGMLDPLLGIPPEAVATDPTPSEAAILIEELEIVSRKLSPLHRQILELRGQGHSIPETANVAGCTERTVYRAEERYESLLRERLQQQRAT